jgi:hypothetical protein
MRESKTASLAFVEYLSEHIFDVIRKLSTLPQQKR